MVGLLFIKIYVRCSRKKSVERLQKKIKSTGIEYRKGNLVLLLQSTELLLKASTFKVPVPIFDNSLLRTRTLLASFLLVLDVCYLGYLTVWSFFPARIYSADEIKLIS